MRSTNNIQFYCRASKANKQGLAHIEMSININGERKFLNTPMMVRPEDFNRKRQPKEITDYCDLMRVRANEIIVELLRNNEPLTTENLMKYIRYGGYKSRTLRAVCDEFLGIQKDRIGVDLSQAAFHKYEVVANKMVDHIGDIEFNTLNFSHISSLKVSFDKHYEPSSASAMMTKTKTIVKYGMSCGYLNTDPFNGIKIHKNLKDVQTITDDDLETIRSRNFVSAANQRIADLFVFSCGSGLAYCDTQELRPEDFVEKDGHLCIFKERRKTGVKYYSVLLPCAEEIARKYDYDFSSLQISNQKTNENLHNIQDACNITSVPSLHFHLARHYYATHLLSAGVPITTVSKCLGHKGIQMSAHYAKVLEKTVVEDVAKIF